MKKNVNNGVTNTKKKLFFLIQQNVIIEKITIPIRYDKNDET